LPTRPKEAVRRGGSGADRVNRPSAAAAD
jgi:hypothetical protein